MKVNVINRSGFPLPEYATLGAAGMDLRASIEESIVLEAGARIFVPTGLYVEIPEGYEMQIRPRSGLAAKRGITVLNSPGTIDSDYRGEICVILYNSSTEDFVIERGERIAQAVVASYQRVEWSSVEELTSSQRGEGGFGSTGVD